MHRRQSMLAHRPRTSSAVDDPARVEGNMKRTASQTFSTHTNDARDSPCALGSVAESLAVADGAPSHSPYASSSMPRAKNSRVKQLCRRMSASSSYQRRPSVQDLFDSTPIAYARKASTDLLRAPLPHHDSAVLTPQQEPQTGGRFLNGFRKFSSIRRRPAASGPSGEFARYNPQPPPIPSNYPSQTHLPQPILSQQAPGAAARQAAAAANDARLSAQKREQEQMRQQADDYRLSSLSPDMEGVLQDNESGVGMSCSSPVMAPDCAPLETMTDPLQRLPAELSHIILSNLDAPDLANAARVSSHWNRIASDTIMWLHVFLRKYEPDVHVSPTPIQMGGIGIGKFSKGKPLCGQDGKAMYKARKAIERRWKSSNASAIYLNGHTDSVYCCQFDEEKIITGSRDRTIRVWDMKTFKCTKVIGGPSHKPVANTPGSLETRPETVVNHPSLNGTLEGDAIWHTPSDYHDASILCLQYDDEIMVTGSSDSDCIVWDITGDEYVPKQRLKGHSVGVLDVCLDAKHIISCSKDSNIIVWDRATGDRLQTFRGHRGPVNAVQLRGNLLVSASGDGWAKLWNLESGACIRDFQSEDRGLAAVEFSDDARYVLAGGNDHVVYKFDTTTGRTVHQSRKHGGLVRSLFLDAFNGHVISGSYDQSIRIWDYATGDSYGEYQNWTTSWILSAKSDYRRVVATSQDGRALILDFGWRTEGSDLLVGSK